MAYPYAKNSMAWSGRHDDDCDNDYSAGDYYSARDIETMDRYDYANAIAAAGDPDRAAEIRMGA